jgi:hypothetical protein
MGAYKSYTVSSYLSFLMPFYFFVDSPYDSAYDLLLDIKDFYWFMELLYFIISESP